MPPPGRRTECATRRRLLVTGAAGWLGGLSGHVRAQPQVRTRRIGYLGYTSVNMPGDERNLAALSQRLREHGFVEGVNLTIDWRFSEGQLERYDQFAIEFARGGIELVIVGSGAAARAVMKASRTTPVVVYAIPDPVKAGLVASLAHPGGQVTGISNLSDDLTPKRLELLKDAVPKAARIVIVRCPRCVREAGQSAAEMSAMYDGQAAAAHSLGVQLMPLTLEASSDFAAFAEALPRSKPDALLINATPVNVALRAELVALAAAHRLPTMAPYRGFGAMLSYGPDVAAIMRTVADYVARILDGAKPADLPMAEPTTFEFAVDQRVARAIGVVIPNKVLLQADVVID